METNPAITAWALNELPSEFHHSFEVEMKQNPSLRTEAQSVQGFCLFLTSQLQDSEAALTDTQREYITSVAAPHRQHLTLLPAVPQSETILIRPARRDRISWFRDNYSLILPLGAAAALVIGSLWYVVFDQHQQVVPQMAMATAPAVKKQQISSPSQPPVVSMTASSENSLLSSASPVSSTASRLRASESQTMPGGASFASLNAAWEQRADRAMPSMQLTPRLPALTANFGPDGFASHRPQAAALALARRGVMHESDSFDDEETQPRPVSTAFSSSPAITVTFGNTLVTTGGRAVAMSHVNMQRTIITTQGVTFDHATLGGGDPLLVVAQTSTTNPVTETIVKKEVVKPDVPPPAAVSAMEPVELAEFEKQPHAVQSVLRRALDLTKKNLTYTFSSHDPARGGMDCSGAVYHVLTEEGIKSAPRQSDEMCAWVMEKSAIHLTENVTSLDDEKFKALQPGDLLFWSGTYEATARKIPVTHVMIYLGKRAKDGKPVIFGSSDGRSYEGQRRCGVSVFDFKLPKAGDKAAFYGYGSVPGLRPTIPENSSEKVTK